MTGDGPEDSVGDGLGGMASAGAGSGDRAPWDYFPAVDGARITEGRVDDLVTKTLIEDPPELAVEQRSSLDSRPALDVTTAQRYLDWLRTAVGTEKMPGLFRRQGTLIRVPRIGEAGWKPPPKGDDGPAQVRPVSASILTDIVSRDYWCYKEKIEVKDEPKSSSGKKTLLHRRGVIPPKDVAQLTVDNISEWYQVPEVRSVSHTQTLRADGSVIAEPGYDKASLILYLPDTLKHSPKWPRDALGRIRVDRAWLKWSTDSLTLLLQDFPFEDERSRLNMLALMLTPLLRLVIPPPYPMWVINAHQRGTGKSLLARVARELHGGVHRPELPVDDEEIRKQITSILTTTTAPVINFDNVTQPIGSGQLANLLTTATWSDRPLGRTATVEADNDRIWVCTGNNVVIGGDLGRRVVRVSLDARMEHPELRKGFLRPDLVGYVKANRGMLLQCLLVQVLWWVQRGMPVAEIRSDDYGRWAGSISEILIGGGLERREELVETGETRMELDPEAGLGEGVPEGMGVGPRDVEVAIMSGVFRRGQESSSEVVTSDEEDELQVLLEMLRDVFGLGVAFQARDVVNRAANPGWAELIVDSLPGRVATSREWGKSLGKYLMKSDKKPAGGLRCEVIATKVRGGNRFHVVEL